MKGIAVSAASDTIPRSTAVKGNAGLLTERTLDALIFDFDGVMVDSEPIHLMSFTEVLRPLGVELTREEYFERYLGFDDYKCLAEALRHHHKPFNDSQIDDMVAKKTRVLQEHLAESIPPIAGVLDLIREAGAQNVPMAICSGALREEVEIGIDALNVRSFFPVTVAAEDVRETKPHPEGYLQAAEMLAQATGQTIRPAGCVAPEDSPTGIVAAKEAGMKVLAVHTSYPPEDLADADRVEKDFTGVTLDSLRAMTD
jgi:HAD superfamily hydrolase (TIGR01509 family)